MKKTCSLLNLLTLFALPSIAMRTLIYSTKCLSYSNRSEMALHKIVGIVNWMSSFRLPSGWRKFWVQLFLLDINNDLERIEIYMNHDFERIKIYMNRNRHFRIKCDKYKFDWFDVNANWDYSFDWSLYRQTSDVSRSRGMVLALGDDSDSGCVGLNFTFCSLWRDSPILRYKQVNLSIPIQ